MPDIHGTDVYPSNAPVCAAARHAGRIDAGGGTVTVQLNPGADEYPGSTRNGVTSYVVYNFTDRVLNVTYSDGQVVSAGPARFTVISN